MHMVGHYDISSYKPPPGLLPHSLEKLVNLLAGEYLFLFLGANREEDDDGPYTESPGRQMDRRTSRGPLLHVASFLEKNLAKG
jgi:hypothetical protein